MLVLVVPIPLTESYAESTGVTSQSSDQKVSTVDDYGRCDNATATTERTLGAVAATRLVDIRKVLKVSLTRNRRGNSRALAGSWCIYGIR